MTADRLLVTQSLQGDRDGFAQLITRYHRMVHATAWSILRDHHSAEDITQATFLKAFHRLPTLQQPETFGTWLVTMARHAALDIARANKRLVTVPSLLATEAPDENLEDDAAPLIAALAQLPEHEQQVIFLHYFNSLPVALIANIHGSPVGTVTKQLSRGLARLRDILKEQP